MREYRWPRAHGRVLGSAHARVCSTAARIPLPLPVGVGALVVECRAGGAPFALTLAANVAMAVVEPELGVLETAGVHVFRGEGILPSVCPVLWLFHHCCCC